MLWDSREPARWDDETGSALSSPALAIQDAHKNQDIAAESARKRRRSVSHPHRLPWYSSPGLCAAEHEVNALFL